MTNTIIIRTKNFSAGEELRLKTMLNKNGSSISLNDHITINNHESIVSQILVKFYDEVFSKDNDSRLDPVIHYRNLEGIWKEVHPFQIIESHPEDAEDYEEDYQFDIKQSIANSDGFFKSADQYRAQLDQVLVI